MSPNSFNSIWQFPFILFFLPFPPSFCQQFIPIVSPSDATRECLELAQNANCPIFTNCCQRKCPQGQGHKCMAFLGMIDKGQSGCDCTPPSTPFPPPSQQQFGQSSSQWPSNFGGQFQTTTKWPSNFGGGQFPPNFASSSQSPPSSSSPSPQWPSPFQQRQFGQNMPSPNQSPNIGTKNQQRPSAGDPAALRPLFQSTGGQTPQTSAAHCHRRKRWNAGGGGGTNWWAEFGRRADFVGSILLLFVVDLLLLTLTF